MEPFQTDTRPDGPGMRLDRHIVDVLAYLRKAHGLTVAELARRAFMSESQLGKVLRSERILKADEFVLLCFALRARGEFFLPRDLAKTLAEINWRTTDGKLLLPEWITLPSDGRTPRA